LDVTGGVWKRPVWRLPGKVQGRLCEWAAKFSLPKASERKRLISSVLGPRRRYSSNSLSSGASVGLENSMR
jgi:hypothetical protein